MLIELDVIAANAVERSGSSSKGYSDYTKILYHRWRIWNIYSTNIALATWPERSHYQASIRQVMPITTLKPYYWPYTVCTEHRTTWLSNKNTTAE